MRIVALLMVVAIIYIVYSRHVTTSSSPEVNKAIATIDANLPPRQGANGSPTPVPARTDYKRALDRAGAVVNEVQRQHAEEANF